MPVRTLELRWESGERLVLNAGAAPATVSGEPKSDERHWETSREDRTEAMTREPGDLPRQNIVLGRGVPVVRFGPTGSQQGDR